MHRLDDADPQVEHIALNERTLRELGFTVGVQPLLQFYPDPIVGPRIDRVGARHLKHEARQRRAPLHLASEPATVKPIQRTTLGRRRPGDQRQPAERMRQLDHRRVLDPLMQLTARTIATGDELASDLHPLTAPISDGRDCSPVGDLLNTQRAHPEANLPAASNEPLGKGGHEFVLRVDEVDTPARERTVIEHKRPPLKTELAHTVRPAVREDRLCQTVRLERSHGAVLHQPCSSNSTERLTGQPLQHDARDLRLLKQQRYHQPSRPGTNNTHLGLERPVIHHARNDIR